MILDLAGQTSLDASNASIESIELIELIELIQGRIEGQSMVKLQGAVDLKASVNPDSKIERSDGK